MADGCVPGDPVLEILPIEAAHRSDPLRSRAERPFEDRRSLFAAAPGRDTEAGGRPFVSEMPAVTLGNRLPREVRGYWAIENRLKRARVVRGALRLVLGRMAASANARAHEIVEGVTSARKRRPNCQDCENSR